MIHMPIDIWEPLESIHRGNWVSDSKDMDSFTSCAFDQVCSLGNGRLLLWVLVSFPINQGGWDGSSLGPHSILMLWPSMSCSGLHSGRLQIHDWGQAYFPSSSPTPTSGEGQPATFTVSYINLCYHPASLR